MSGLTGDEFNILYFEMAFKSLLHKMNICLVEQRMPHLQIVIIKFIFFSEY